MINKQNMNEMYDSINLGSLCQLIRVKRLYLACNQYHNHYTDIKSGVKIVERHDCRSASWDNFNFQYENSNDTFVTAYCRKTGVFEYENTDFPDEDYTDVEYVVMHIINIDDKQYINRILSDIDCNNKNSKISIFDRTPIFAKESYLDTLEELDFSDEELEENKGF